ncbi:hypothetical protein TNIN_329221 [Trichonephila inaurata madagascariensis]|uniref:Uncharacterized protein n=1 Tax=Trichonephila inaurata madagascariensis TaxID=2747483 RepID=A0A8X6WU00_9ARAC|nr:hypothetical protein TNIN_329221 [Trichonephila inaurata madagascariensis]
MFSNLSKGNEICECFLQDFLIPFFIPYLGRNYLDQRKKRDPSGEFQKEGAEISEPRQNKETSRRQRFSQRQTAEVSRFTTLVSYEIPSTEVELFSKIEKRHSLCGVCFSSSLPKCSEEEIVFWNSTPSVRRYLIGGDIQTTEVKTIILSRLLLKFKRMKVATDDSKECGMATLAPERGGMKKNKKDLFKSGTRRSLLFRQKAV